MTGKQPHLSVNGKKLGRPTKFNKRVAMAILLGISDGKSLKSICKADDMPERTTVYLWLANAGNKIDDVSFFNMYDGARADGTDSMADDIQELSDEAGLSKEAILKARLQVDTRKWIASKLKPRKYGDKLDMTSDGEKLEGLVIVQSDTHSK